MNVKGNLFEVWLKGFSGWISITNRAGARVLPTVTHTHFLFPLPHRFTTLSFSHWWKFSHGDLGQEVNHVIYTWKSNFTFWDLILISREVNLGVLFCNHCKLFCLVLHLSYSLPELYSSFCSSRNCLLLCGADLSSFLMLFFYTSLNLVRGIELLQCWEELSIKVKYIEKKKKNLMMMPVRACKHMMLKQLSNVIWGNVLPCWLYTAANCAQQESLS